MTEDEIIIGVLTGKIPDGTKFEHIQPNYNEIIHGCYYRIVLYVKGTTIRKEYYDQRGGWRNTMWVLGSRSNDEYEKI